MEARLRRARFALAEVRRKLEAMGPIAREGSEEEKAQWLRRATPLLEQATEIVERLTHGEPAPHLRSVEPSSDDPN